MTQATTVWYCPWYRGWFKTGFITLYEIVYTYTTRNTPMTSLNIDVWRNCIVDMSHWPLMCFMGIVPQRTTIRSKKNKTKWPSARHLLPKDRKGITCNIYPCHPIFGNDVWNVWGPMCKRSTGSECGVLGLGEFFMADFLMEHITLKSH